MDSLLFIIVIACLVLVAGWYLGNELRGEPGGWGLLAIISEIRERMTSDKRGYRMKSRRGEQHDAEADDDARYRATGEKRRFHETGDARYRPLATSPRFRNRPNKRKPPAESTPPNTDD